LTPQSRTKSCIPDENAPSPGGPPGESRRAEFLRDAAGSIPSADFLIDPDYGGNDSGAGWKVIGRERRAHVQAAVRFFTTRIIRLATTPKEADKNMMADQPSTKTSDEVDFVIIGSALAAGSSPRNSQKAFGLVVSEQGPY